MRRHLGGLKSTIYVSPHDSLLLPANVYHGRRPFMLSLCMRQLKSYQLPKLAQMKGGTNVARTCAQHPVAKLVAVALRGRARLLAPHKQ